MLLPAECRTKDDIRAEIDRLDRELMALLAARFGYVRRMAELKSSPADAHDQGRVYCTCTLRLRQDLSYPAADV
jgi:isochorismate pyruvate lyase